VSVNGVVGGWWLVLVLVVDEPVCVAAKPPTMLDEVDDELGLGVIAPPPIAIDDVDDGVVNDDNGDVADVVVVVAA
jgi:hypothetical protein